MLINWAPIWEGVHVGGGVNLYSQQIGLELTRRGYEVISVFSGFTYNLIPFSYIRTHKPWQQIHSFEIINSPCLAPGRDNSGYPKGELKNRRIIKLFQKILDVIKPDVVHFNNIEGFCSHCVYLARKQGARVIFSLHNYYTVCPQVFLLFKDKEICYDYQDGRRCYHCVPHKSYWLQRIKRGLLSVLAATGNPQRYKSLIYDVYRGYHSTIQSFGEYFHFVYRGIQQSAIESIEQNENPKIHSSYKLRRHSMIDSLNECHEVLAVSDFVAQKFIQMGVNPDLVKVNHVGSSIGKLVAGYRKRHPTISNRQHATLPLRVVFIGNSGNYKGLPVLLEALENLPKRRRADLKLFIYAQHVESLLGRIEALRSTLADLHIHKGYEFSQLPSILEGKDVGIVPPVWWDPAPQVVMELLANNIPVIAANIGGIPDFIENGVNGLLFQAGNSEDLSAKICYILDNPKMLNEWRNHIQSIKTIEQHVDELQLFYGF